MNLRTFQRERDFLLCVDSDGCAMDTMNIKHTACFGPCLVEEWGLKEWENPVLRRWNDINLYTKTRGINRFKGLAMILDEINERYTCIPGMEEFRQWTENARELSNDALRRALPQAEGPCLEKALAWSEKVNAAIDALPPKEKKPFPNVLEALVAAHQQADVAVVSSANREAVEEEWTRCGLLSWVDVICCQDDGSKSACLSQLRSKGYGPQHILMVGDAPGDQAAARDNGVLFYPILARQEGENWLELLQRGLSAFFSGRFGPYGEVLACRFKQILG